MWKNRVRACILTRFSLYFSFTELDIRGIELDDKGVLAAASLMKSSSLSVLNMAGCEIQNVSVVLPVFSIFVLLNLWMSVVSPKSLSHGMFSVLSVEIVCLQHGAQVMCKALAGTTVQLLNLDLSSCRLSREPALEVCHKMASIYGLSTLNLSNNQLSEQVCLDSISVIQIVERTTKCVAAHPFICSFFFFCF